jgi:hypothetical protein
MILCKNDTGIGVSIVQTPYFSLLPSPSQSSSPLSSHPLPFPSLLFSSPLPYVSSPFLFFSFVSEAGSNYNSQAELELVILLPQPPESWAVSSHCAPASQFGHTNFKL